MRFEQMSLFEKGSQQWSESHKANTEPDNRDEYEQFLDKFKTKKTTDDCYTPANIYDAVANWTAVEYGLDRAAFVRPFFPGGDFENFDYKDDTIVVDNPPFSILSSIINFYIGNDIKFFLFAPALTLFSTMKPGVCWLPVGATITYENGAKVSTSFITNLDTARLRCVPELYRKNPERQQRKRTSQRTSEVRLPDARADRCKSSVVHEVRGRVQRQSEKLHANLRTG